MSECIYDDVIRTESKGMNRERVEMMVDIYESADAVRDHDFRTETDTHQPLQQTGSDGVRNRSSRAAAVCLVLLCVLLLTAVIALCVHIQTKSTEERDQLLTKITNLTEERDGLLIKNINLKNKSRGLLNQIKNLTKQRDQLNIETNELWKSLSKMDGWIHYKFHLYFISSEKKNWTESRRYCTERGADLIIINNREKQDIVKNISDGNRLWIGLNDRDKEGRWKWVDGSTLNSGFWWYGEPNGGGRENCAQTRSSLWADYPCKDNSQWICEKTIKTSY